MVEQVKSSNTSANASANASAGASHARGHGKLAAGAGAGFTGLLDDFSAALTDGADASATLGVAGADGAGDLGALLAGGQGQARRKPGVKGVGDDTDALTAENGALPTDLVSQMALLAESARQAAAGATADAKTPANGAGAGLPAGMAAGADVTKATTDPAVLAQMAAAAQKDAGVAGASATGVGAAGDAGRVSLESGAMARKGCVLHNTYMEPTAKTYSELQVAYDTFNAALFDSALPPCLLTLQREKRTYGYFSARRFGTRSGQTTDLPRLSEEFAGARARFRRDYAELDDGHDLVASLPRLLAETDRFLAALPA